MASDPGTTRRRSGAQNSRSGDSEIRHVVKTTLDTRPEHWGDVWFFSFFLT